MTVDELESVISSDFACVNEYQLLQFILEWGAANDGNKYDVGRLLEHVRFTKMSMQQYFEAVALDQLTPFLHGCNKLKSLSNAKKFHDPRPVTTRKLGRLKKMNS